MSGSDTIDINGRVLVDLADGDFVGLTYPNDIAELKTGKNNNSIYSFNSTGRQTELTIRLIRGSSDDKYMNGLLQTQQADFARTILLTAVMSKKIGDGKGNVISDTYIMSGGIFSKQVETKSNAEGDTEQSVSVYTMMYSNSPRAIG